MNNIKTEGESEPGSLELHDITALGRDLDVNSSKYSTDLHYAKKLVSLSNRCRRKNLEFGLSMKRLKQLVATKKCYYTGVEFIEGHNELSRTLDRRDNTKGYTDDNVVACTAIINQRKSDLTIDQILALAKKLEKFQTKNKSNGTLKRVQTKRKKVV